MIMNEVKLKTRMVSFQNRTLIDVFPIGRKLLHLLTKIKEHEKNNLLSANHFTL